MTNRDIQAPNGGDSPHMIIHEIGHDLGFIGHQIGHDLGVIAHDVGLLESQSSDTFGFIGHDAGVIGHEIGHSFELSLDGGQDTTTRFEPLADGEGILVMPDFHSASAGDLADGVDANG